MPKISVIVPVYNASKYLSRCIESVLCQSFCDFELILINDGSTDQSEKICMEYSQKDLRIKYIKQRNQGVSHARNTGIRISKSTYITFLDSDDYLLPEALSVFYSYAIKYNADICIATAVFASSNKVANDSFNIIEHDGRSAVEHYGQLNNYQFRAPWAKLFKRGLFANMMFPESLSNGEDFYLIHKLMYIANRIININEPVYWYNDTNTSSVTNRTFNEKKMDDLYAYESLLDFLKEKNFMNLHKKFFEEYLLKIAFYCENIKKQNVDYSASKRIRKKFRNAIKKYGKYYDFEKYSQNKFVLRMAYPRKSKVKKRIKKYKNSILHRG